MKNVLNNSIPVSLGLTEKVQPRLIKLPNMYLNGGFTGVFINSHRYHCYYYHDSVNYAFHGIAECAGCTLCYTLLNWLLSPILRKQTSFVPMACFELFLFITLWKSLKSTKNFRFPFAFPSNSHNRSKHGS